MTNHIQACNIILMADQVDVVYFDFSKAFDRLNHFHLLQKLRDLGMNRETLEMIASFIKDRKYRLKADNVKSNDSIYPLSGIPQGSHIGPLLYTLYCNDITEAIQTECPDVNIIQYADDTKLLMKIRTPQSHLQLQKAIHHLNAWSTMNHLPLNHTKTQAMSFKKDGNPEIYQYKVEGTEIERPLTIKDLGLIYDSRLTFSAHFNNAVITSRQQIGASTHLIRKYRSKTLAIHLFKCYYLPKLEYAYPIWCTESITRKNKIEKQLQRASRIAFGYHNRPPYEVRLRLTSTLKITQRLEIQQIITCIKILRCRYITTSYQIIHASLNTTQPGRSIASIFNIRAMQMPRNHPLVMMMSAVNRRQNLFNFWLDTIFTIKAKLKQFFIEQLQTV